jgi:hypothetical protein
MTRYKTTIKAREKQAQEFVDIIREAFDYNDTVFVVADVEGQPNPDKDFWTVRAEVQQNKHIVFKLGPHTDRGQAILAAIAVVEHAKGRWERQARSELRESFMDIEEARVWISRAWMHLNPNDLDVLVLDVDG